MSEEISVSETSLMKVGAVGVDSGRIMLLDPCNEGKRTSDVECEYLPGVRIVLRDEIPLGVIVATPGGDGVFPVIAEIVDGRLNGLLLDFGDEDLEKGILGARMIARGDEAPEIVGPVEPVPTADQRDQLRYVEGWQGTPPAEGTRRALIRDAIGETLEGCDVVVKPDDRPFEGDLPLALADRVEEALLKVVDQGATPESGSPASVAMDLLDSFEIPRTREGAILTIADRVTALADLLVETRRERDVKQATIEGLAATVSAKADALERRVDGLTKLTSREGKVRPGTQELRIVLERISHPQAPPEFRFIELEDQDGRGVGGFPVREGDRNPFYEITIPYGRDDGWVSEVAYQVAGAATRPLLEDHPDYVFPAERVRSAVADLLKDFGIARACRGCAEEEIEHGRKEAGDRRDDTIKGLKAEVDRLLEGRESARAGEDTFKAQRDAALHLLRWLIGDIIPPGLVEFAGEDPS